MTRIDPTTLYTRADLDAMLAPLGIDVDGWLAKIRPERRFRLAYWGGDLIRAIESTSALGTTPGGGESGNRADAGANARKGGTGGTCTGASVIGDIGRARGGKGRRSGDDALAPLRRLMRKDGNSNAES